MLRHRSRIERILPRRYAALFSALRQSMCDTSHYGQSRFRSVTIAVCFILTGQMHVIASVSSSGGAEKCFSYDPAISYYEMVLSRRT